MDTAEARLRVTVGGSKANGLDVLKGARGEMGLSRPDSMGETRDRRWPPKTKMKKNASGRTPGV